MASRSHVPRTLYLLGLGLVAIGITLTTFYPSLRDVIQHSGMLSGLPAEVIPRAYRGQWIEDGAECGDRDAELSVGGHSIVTAHLAGE